MLILHRKKTILKRSLMALFGAVLISMATFSVIRVMMNTVDAASAYLEKGSKIDYASYSTRWYTVDGKRAFCIDPDNQDSPETGTQTSVLQGGGMKNDKIKLMMYINTVQNDTTNPIMDSIASRLGVGNDTEQRYAFSHAIIGYINKGSTAGLSSSQISTINTISGELEGYINNSSSVWLMARNYNLYFTDPKTTSAGTYEQQVGWIEYAPVYGNIKVTKIDSETNSSTPQGNATFDGITFTVTDAAGTQVASHTLTGGETSYTFANLLQGTYTVSESATNASYPVKVTGNQSATISASGQTVSLSFANTAKRGNVTVNKKDAETNSCTAVAELSLTGVTLQLLNNSNNAIYYNGQSIAKGAVIDTKTLGSGQCSVVFDNLPYGKYTVKETKAATGYTLSTKTYDIDIPTNNQINVTMDFPNQVIRGDLKFVKMDSANNKPMENVAFSIARLDNNKNIKEIHIVVSDKNGVVNTASSFALHSKNTNGYDAPYSNSEPLTFAGYGTWFGIDNNGRKLPVNDNLGALHYGTYLIQELRCDSNFFCTNILNQYQTVVIDQPNQVVDLGNWDNDCTKFELSTTAIDAEDGDHYIEVVKDKEVTIKDTISYTVKPNTEFTIKGIVMDKTTKKPLLIDGKTVEKELVLNSKTDKGTVDMLFTFDASKSNVPLGGRDLVVFENIYYKGNLMVAHEDFNDKSQTVTMLSLRTYAVNNDTNDKTLPLDADVTIKDTVYYCLKPGVEYTVKGVIMDKKTGNGLLVNSQPVESEIKFTPTDACGTVDMFYTFNTTGLGGAELVIFESLYLGNALLFEHKDINNADESVAVELPVPDTGFVTGASVGGSEESNMVYVGVIAGVAVVSYVVMRGMARKRFLHRR